jgi:peptidoglycan/xylan/chitin deacetylase (PgdA/CDA1 family)
LNRLLEQADDLPVDGPMGTTQLALPALDEAAAQLTAFVAAQ